MGKYQSKPIIADGNASDWGLPLRFGSEIGSLQYSITNDKENIYISVASNGGGMGSMRGGGANVLSSEGYYNTRPITNWYQFKLAFQPD